MSSTMSRSIIELLGRFRFRVGRELDLQDGVSRVLADAGIAVLREFRLTRGPIDFYATEGRVGIECKVDGSRGEVARQLVDYADDALVDALVLVTSKPSHVAGLGPDLCGKPFGVVKLWRSL